jgi:hypothetical protein
MRERIKKEALARARAFCIYSAAIFLSFTDLIKPSRTCRIWVLSSQLFGVFRLQTKNEEKDL